MHDVQVYKRGFESLFPGSRGDGRDYGELAGDDMEENEEVAGYKPGYGVLVLDAGEGSG